MPRSINSVTISPCLATVIAPDKRHHYEAFFVASHRLQHVGGLAQLAPGKRGLRHRPHQVVDRLHLRQIERLQRNQPVLNRIVQAPFHPVPARALRDFASADAELP